MTQQQWRLSPAWNAYIGVRFDDSRNHTHFVSPRVALVYQASAKSTYKFLFGRAFRNPNAYETFYDDGSSQVANPLLRPEHAITYEVDAEHRLTKNWNGQVSVYHYQLSDLIEAETIDGHWCCSIKIALDTAPMGELELGGKVFGTDRNDGQRHHSAGHRLYSGGFHEFAGLRRQISRHDSTVQR
jgi:hypothetical protein